MSDWLAGTEVRLVADPGTRGICTGITRQRGGTLMVQIAFPGLGKTFQPEYALERTAEGTSDPFDLIREGRYGGATHLRRYLAHIQLSGKLANLVYSMETTHTDFYAYQYKPVLALLESPANGLLIADEVGLGKTIEAGLIWTELRARLDDARRLVVLCPAMLREKWKLELGRRFGVEAEIVGADEFLDALRRPKDELPDGRAIIASFQGLRPPRGWREDAPEGEDTPRRRLARFLQERADNAALIDLLVVDEAHYLRNPESLSFRLGQLLREISQHVVLLSATPINLSNDDLFTLLNLADPDTFRYREFFPNLLRRNAPLVRAREVALSLSSTEEDIKSLLRESVDPLGVGGENAETRSRSLNALLEVPLPMEYLAERANRVKLANRIERLNLLGHVVNRTRKAEVTEFRTVRRPVTETVPMTAAEDAFYSRVTEAIRDYAWARGVSDGFLLAAPQRQVSSCMVAAARAWRKREGHFAELLYEDLGAELDDGDSAPLIETLVREVLPNIDIEELEREDSKYERLRDVLVGHLAEYPTDKIILFSYFRGTLRYLHVRLQKDGIASQLLMGGMSESKQTTIDNFRESPEVRILLSSEVAAEGVDLQFSRVLVNYDLPWNPMKVEQRIGRIDRIGQAAESIVIWNLCAEKTIDERILSRLYGRLRLFERALGGFEAILGEQIQALTTDLLSRRLTPEEELRRIDQSAIAIENVREQQEQLEAQASNLIAHGGYVLDAVHAAHEFSRRITDNDLFTYVRDYLERNAPGHTLQQVSTDPPEFELRLPPAVAARLAEFVKLRRMAGQTQLATGDVRRCCFVNKVQLRQQRVEQISQFHPLVRFVSEELSALNEAFYPLLAVRLPQSVTGFSIPTGQYVFVVKRWYFSGLRTEEELRARVVGIEADSELDEDPSLNLVNQARANGDDWHGAGNVLEPGAVTAAMNWAEELVQRDYEEASRDRENDNQDRVELQKESLRQHQERRLQRLEATLGVHKALGRKGLVAATEGQIRKLQQRIEIQLNALTQKEQLKRAQFDVCMGVIKVD